ncbi:MAG: alpha/beta hydrolase [Natronospirillum sp.]
MTTPLNTQLADWLDKLNRITRQQRSAGSVPTPISAREGLANMTSTLVTRKPVLPWIADALVQGDDYAVPVRIYDPDPSIAKPVCIYIHGGGHIAGGVSVYDPICRKLAASSHQLVVSIEYRLAPECPYPSGLNDCRTVVMHLWDTLDRLQRHVLQELTVVGDSGGGALTATLSAQLQDAPERLIDRQILIYPNLDYTLKHASIDNLAEGYMLEKRRIEWYYELYFQHHEDRRALSPLNMPITNRLPDTLIITAGYCPLKDEAVAYLERLEAVGVTNQHVHFPDLLHAFLNMEDLIKDDCKHAYDAMARFMNSGKRTQTVLKG